MVMDRRMRFVRERKTTAQDVREFAQTISSVFPVDVPEEPVNAPETGVHEAEVVPEPEKVSEPETRPEEAAPKPKRTRKRKVEPEPENDIVDMLLG